MPKDQAQRYAESLEKNIKMTFTHLKKTVDEFQEMCKTISPDRHIPRDVIVDTREIYKEIQERTKEIKAIQQLLDGRYRMYAKRDPIRDKEILEMGFLAKSSYSKFEYILMQIEEKAKAKEREKVKEREKAKELESWVRSQESQRKFSKYLMTLKSPEHEAHKERGLEATEGKVFMLIVVKGDSTSLDQLVTRFPWSETDIVDRYSVDELRAVLPHNRQGSLSEVENTLRQFSQSDPFSKMKYLLLRASSLKGMQTGMAHGVEKPLREMVEGEVRVLSI